MNKTLARIWLAFMGTMVLVDILWLVAVAPMFVAFIAGSISVLAILLLTFWAIDTLTK